MKGVPKYYINYTLNWVKDGTVLVLSGLDIDYYVKQAEKLVIKNPS